MTYCPAPRERGAQAIGETAPAKCHADSTRLPIRRVDRSDALRRASSRFFMSPLDLDFDLLAESACCLNQRIQLDGNIAWIQYTI